MRTWSLWFGCSAASVGCLNCYAAKPEFAAGLTRTTKAGPVWTGELRRNDAELLLPLEVASRAEFAVNPHGDLFHENAPDAWIDEAFDVIDKAPWHSFHILTKRAKRMRDYLVARYQKERPRNIILGVSAERQPEADARLPHLFDAPALIRSVTLYPLLGPIDLLAIPGVTEAQLKTLYFVAVGEDPQRPADPSWIEHIRDTCKALRIPFQCADLASQVAERGW